MAMQTKLVFSYKIFDGSNFISIRPDGYRDEVIIDKNIFSDGNLGNELVSFAEHLRTEVLLISDDPNAALEIESYNSEEIVVESAGNIVALTPGMEHDNMLVPGSYPISIKTSEGLFHGFYSIIPSSVNSRGLLNIRKCLEATVKGLSYNIYLRRNGHSENLNKSNIFLFEVYKYLEENKDVLVNNIKAIADKPIIDIYKEYDLRSYTSSQDSKSLRWQSKKGKLYNNNPFQPSVYYEKHSELTYDIRENKLLKKILNRIYELLVQLDNNYSGIKFNIIERVGEINYQLEKARAEFERLKRISNIKKAQTELKNNIELLLGEKERYIENLVVIDSYLNNVGKTKNMIGHYLNETWLKEISGYDNIFKPTIKLLKNKNYSQIYEVYRNLNIMKEEGMEGTSYPYKKTSKLFEIYGYILIKEIFEEMGFQWVSGWLKDIDNVLEYNGDLLSGETILLNKNNFNVELIYDKEISKSSDVKNTNISQLVSVNSRSRRPDITINLYEGNTFKGTLIVEVKCRKKRYIYNENADTDVIYQLKDYSALKYYEGDKKSISRHSHINKIIVLYPKQDGECKFRDDLYDFTFIQVEPTDLMEKPYGYNEIREEVEEFLESCLDSYDS